MASQRRRKNVTIRSWLLKKRLTDTLWGYIILNTPMGYIELKRGVAMAYEPTCCHRTKERTEAEYKSLVHRLNRIEGQIRGIRGMLERSAYCPDILAQAAAANAALNAFSRELLEQHLRTCVVQDIRQGKDETIDELMDTLRKLMR